MAGRADGGPAAVVAGLLAKRIVFLAGKGGTGKSSIAAALALIAGRRGRRVLCIEVDGKGALAACLGSSPVSFTPRVVQPNVSLLQMDAEASLEEYLHIYFHVPKLARLTPLARVFDFVAKGVPGAKDMLIVGKIAYEAKRLEGGRPAWDLIVVDAEATGHVLPQLSSAHAMMDLAKGGIIHAQVEWIDAMLHDSRRTALTICALPEEMPVTEAIELHDRARDEAGIAAAACFLNRILAPAVTTAQRRLLEVAAAPEHAEEAGRRLGGDVVPLLEGVRMAQRLAESSSRHLRRLRAAMSCPVVGIPVQAGVRPGLAVSRQIAAALEHP